MSTNYPPSRARHPKYTDTELARNLRDRAAKIAGRDPNSAAWLDLAAARLEAGVDRG